MPTRIFSFELVYLTNYEQLVVQAYAKSSMNVICNWEVREKVTLIFEGNVYEFVWAWRKKSGHNFKITSLQAEKRTCNCVQTDIEQYRPVRLLFSFTSPFIH